MTQPEHEIRRAWRQIAGQHRDDHLDSLMARYRQPHRHYHTAVHIMWVLRHVRELSPAPSMELLAAVLFHDAVYEPGARDNEARSAAVASEHLRECDWTEDRCAVVEQLIRATATHEPGAATADTVVLLDADLAILGADPNDYSAYVSGVRAEYAHLDDDEWATGRTAVLQHFLQRDRLFTTTQMYAAREVRARANMAAELAALRHR